MLEELLVTARSNPKIDPVLGIWSWEIPVYLFLGGLTAGIMFFAALMWLLKKDSEAPFAAQRLALWAPIVLSVGMGALFLDLEHKFYVFRFYTTFQPTSPMSWGAWILIFIYPISILLILATLREGYPKLAGYLDQTSAGNKLLNFAQRYRLGIAGWNIPFAIALAIYTGILLSAFSSRPFWNTGILGPLFLVSGLSSAAALVVLASKTHSERHLFTKIDVGLILVELFIVALLLINLSTGAQQQLQALDLILGGEFTVMFWLYFFALGLLAPLLLESLELRTGRALLFLGPLLVLFGGYMLRHVTVELGQVSTWTDYATQFNSDLLHRLY